MHDVPNPHPTAESQDTSALACDQTFSAAGANDADFVERALWAMHGVEDVSPIVWQKYRSGESSFDALQELVQDFETEPVETEEQFVSLRFDQTTGELMAVGGEVEVGAVSELWALLG